MPQCITCSHSLLQHFIPLVYIKSQCDIGLPTVNTLHPNSGDILYQHTLKTLFSSQAVPMPHIKHPNLLTKMHNYNSSGSSEIKGYGVTWHPGTRSFMNFAATSAFDFPISACLWRTCILLTLHTHSLKYHRKTSTIMHTKLLPGHLTITRLDSQTGVISCKPFHNLQH